MFGAAGDPVGQKFVGSLARPGGNITRTSFDADPEMTTKQIHLLVDTIPNVGRVAILWNPTIPFIRTYWQAAQNSAAALRLDFQSTEVSDPKEFEPAFEAMVRQDVDAVVVLSDSFMTTNRETIAQFAANIAFQQCMGITCIQRREV